jgi:hypothetical protein
LSWLASSGLGFTGSANKSPVMMANAKAFLACNADNLPKTAETWPLTEPTTALMIN